MAEAKSKADWNQTSALLALIGNAFRDPKKGKPFTPSDFNPHERQNNTEAPAPKLTDLSILKSVFVDRRI